MKAILSVVVVVVAAILAAVNSNSTANAQLTTQVVEIRDETAQQLSPENRRRVAFLRENAVQLKSIDPHEADFADLAPLRKMIGQARIVQLGEQSHGDGAAFHAKIRLIKFLHLEMGFDVLAFESGLYDCRKAWERFQAGDEPLAAGRTGIFGIWTQSQQVLPLLEHLSQHAQSKRPLELCGFDCQFTATGSREHLIDDLKQFTINAKPPLVNETNWTAIKQTLRRLMDSQAATSVEDQQAGRAALEHLQQALDTVKIAADQTSNRGPNHRELAFWRQFARSTLVQAESKWARETGKATASSSARDRQMGENLIWLAREYYPKRKIIVWAATFHIMRNPAGIDVPGRPDFYAQTVTMGDVVSQKLGDDVFTVGFTAYEGRRGLPWTRSFPLPPVRPDGLEYLLARAELDNAVIGFRNLGEDGAWLADKWYSRPLGYLDAKASWPKVLDAMVFTRRMFPSTRIKGE